MKKKLAIFLAITIGFAIFFMVVMEGINFFKCLVIGAAFGFMFSIPGRLRDHILMGWFMMIVITVACMSSFGYLLTKPAVLILFILFPVLFPIGDMVFTALFYRKEVLNIIEKCK